MTTAEELRAAIKCRDQIAVELRAADQEVARLGREYSKERGYLLPMRIESLRAEVGV